MTRLSEDDNRMGSLPNVSTLRPYVDRSGMAPQIASNWRLAAACQSTNPDLFFPVSSKGESAEDVVAAKAVCAHCPVQRECLAFALRTRQAHGIWGGTTEEERRWKTSVREYDRTTLDRPAIA